MASWLHCGSLSCSRIGTAQENLNIILPSNSRHRKLFYTFFTLSVYAQSRKRRCLYQTIPRLNTSVKP